MENRSLYRLINYLIAGIKTALINTLKNNDEKLKLLSELITLIKTDNDRYSKMFKLWL